MPDPTSRTRARPRAARIQAALAASVFAAAILGIANGVEWVAAWFYDLSWWSYIVLVDALVHLRRGESLLLSRPRVFFLLALWSAAFWLFFELVNFRLENWYYVGIPRDLWTRGPGVFLSFATVLPGVLETYELVRSFGFASKARTRGFRLQPAALRATTCVGVAFLVLPVLFPRTFYPLIWGASVLLAEPWLAARGERSLLSTLAAGNPRPVLRLLAAGLFCGFLWESLNAHAHAKWIYTVPLLEEAKLFEMPYAGFLGFPPFALECYTFARVLVALRVMPEWELGVGPGRERRRGRELSAACLAVIVSIPVIVGVNVLTLRATKPELDEIVGVTGADVERLQRSGITTVRELVAAGDGGATAQLGEHDEVLRWIETARLMHVRGLGARGVRWLASAGVRTVDELARADADELLARFANADPRPDLPLPRAAEVRVWVRGARAASGQH